VLFLQEICNTSSYSSTRRLMFILKVVLR